MIDLYLPGFGLRLHSQKELPFLALVELLQSRKVLFVEYLILDLSLANFLLEYVSLFLGLPELPLRISPDKVEHIMVILLFVGEFEPSEHGFLVLAVVQSLVDFGQMDKWLLDESGLLGGQFGLPGVDGKHFYQFYQLDQRFLLYLTQLQPAAQLFL